MELKLTVLFLCCVLRNQLTNAIECYSCDSAVNSECAIKPGEQIEVEECTTATDECVTYIDSGYTRRGCLSRIFPSKYCNSAVCERCSTSLCNVEIYPANRLKCYQCIDCTDVGKYSEYLLPCPIYKKDDLCYTNINYYKTVQRGCVSTDLLEKCTNVCLKCNYDGCNNELGTYEHKCISCTHTPANPNVDCLRSQNVNGPIDAHCKLNKSASALKTCNSNVIYGFKEQCYTHFNAVTGALVRGCASAINLYESGDTTFCYGHECNTDCVNIGCNVCDSGDNNLTWQDAANCRQGGNLQSKNCNTDVYDCFSCEMGTKVRRGCADKDFRSVTNALAQPPTVEEICYRCRGVNGCNKQSVRTCYQCSSLNDADCSSMSDRTGINQHRCSTANELCASTVYNKLNVQYVLRGCVSMLPECTTNDVFCVRCNASLCNYAPIHIENYNDNSNVYLNYINDFSLNDHAKSCKAILKFSTANIFYIVTIFLLFLHYDI